MPLLSSGNELKTDAPFTFLLFGASGHLAQQKIYPALYVLALKKRLPKEYALIGFARSEMSEGEFRSLVEKSIRAQMIEVNEKVLSDLLTNVSYHQGQYDGIDSYRSLAKNLNMEWTTIAYLSVPPQTFSDIFHNLCTADISTGNGGFRCIIEKPVGHDLESFEKLRKDLLGCFPEEQIYLLDHYLGKEAVRNIYYLRYANPVLERILKNTLIHHVEVTAMEATGIEGRAGYFEHTGTLRDMVQSHLLLMCALLTMRLHESGESMRSVRLNALEQFYLPPARDLNDLVLQGQYDGYRAEADVGKDSRTNTFIALKLRTRISRWEGVPFVLRTGKRLAKKETRISLQFQEPRTIGEGSGPNRLDIILQGEAGMRLHLQTKLGGTAPVFRPLVMEDPLVCVGDCLPEHALLLLEAIHGMQQWFLTFDEVKTAWQLIDPLQSHLDQPTTPLYVYKAGSSGPAEAEGWIKREGIAWF